MAENILYDRHGTRSEDSEAGERTRQVQIREEEINEERKIGLLCEVCVGEDPSVLERLPEVQSWYEERVAVYLCFDCVMYVCRNCLPRHRSHRGMKVGRKEREMEGEASGSDRMEVQSSSERMKKGMEKKKERMRLEEENERDKEREKSESERMEEESEGKIRLLLDDLMKESKTERMEEESEGKIRLLLDDVMKESKTERMEEESEGKIRLLLDDVMKESKTERMEEESEGKIRLLLDDVMKESKTERMEEESEGKIRLLLDDLMKESKTERMEEESEGKIRLLLDDLMKESKTERMEEESEGKIRLLLDDLMKESKTERMEEESEGKIRLLLDDVMKESKTERMEEESEGKIRLLLDDLMKESKTERMEKFENSQVRIYDRVNVKHELDRNEECWITGLCALENTRWVACDYNNGCIKIFSLGSNVLQRYIRIVEAGPWDVTEILVNQNSTEPNLGSGSRSEVSVTDRAEQDKRCLVAVTLVLERQIVFIDLSKKPALLHKVIHTEGLCYSVVFHDGKIFTLCEDHRDFFCSVYIKSTDGVTIKKFDTGIDGVLFSEPYLTVVSGRVYLAGDQISKVQCRNFEGQLINEITFEGSRPAGISVDPDNNVYVCARWQNKLYKMDADLTRYKSVLDQTPCDIGRPQALCCYRDQLFISHDGPTSFYNHVTVVQLL